MFDVRDTTFGETIFGTDELETLIPEFIPKYFYQEDNHWHKMAKIWFELGISNETKFIRHIGSIINKEAAIKHLKCLLNTNSIFLSRNDKIAATAYLTSMWFKEVK